MNIHEMEETVLKILYSFVILTIFIIDLTYFYICYIFF